MLTGIPSQTTNTANSFKAPAIENRSYLIILAGGNLCNRLSLWVGKMQGLMPDGPENPYRRKPSGKKPEGDKMVVGGRGVMNFYRKDAIPENTISTVPLK
jgi:hypothetical protein